MNAAIIFSCGVIVGAVLMGVVVLALREVRRLTADEEADVLTALNAGRPARYR